MNNLNEKLKQIEQGFIDLEDRKCNPFDGITINEYKSQKVKLKDLHKQLLEVIERLELFRKDILELESKNKSETNMKVRILEALKELIGDEK